MLTDAKARLAKLEGEVPNDIVLGLSEGTSLHYEGSALAFAMDGMREACEGGGPIVNACQHAVRVSGNLGRLHELIRAAVGPILEEREGKSC